MYFLRDGGWSLGEDLYRCSVSCTDVRAVAQVFSLQPCLLHGPWLYNLISRSLSGPLCCFFCTFQTNLGPYLVLDHVWSALYWWRNLFLSPCSPARVLRDCVLVSESTALILSSQVAHLQREATFLLPHATTIHQIHIWRTDIWHHG